MRAADFNALRASGQISEELPFDEVVVRQVRAAETSIPSTEAESRGFFGDDQANEKLRLITDSSERSRRTWGISA